MSVRIRQLCAVSVAAMAMSANVLAGQVTVTRTNLVERWITNEVEVRMPVNRFVNQYHTNWVQEFHTNLVNVIVYSTNFVPRVHTNQVWVDVPRTTYVQVYRTNWTTMNLTNFNTVLLFKTNWVNQPVTNVVDINLSTRPAAPVPGHPTRHAGASPAKNVGPLAIDAKRGSHRVPRNQVDVLLSVRWTTGSASPLLVQQWRVQSEDGSVLCFGQDPQFSRALPPGRYKIEVEAQRDENAPMLTATATLIVAADVNVQQFSMVRSDD